MRLGQLWVIALMALAICSLEAGLRLGASSPDTRFTLPQYSLGYFWDTPLGWTGLVSGVPVNKDSVQFASLASFFRNEPTAPVPLEDNVYTRFAGYALVGSVLAPLVGAYSSSCWSSIGPVCSSAPLLPESRWRAASLVASALSFTTCTCCRRSWCSMDSSAVCHCATWRWCSGR